MQSSDYSSWRTMSKRKRKDIVAVSDTTKTARTNLFGYVRKHLWLTGLIVVLALSALAGGLKYLEEDARREIAKNSNERSLLSSVNPFIPPPTPAPTPQLSKEYIYAGSRLLAVEDVGASAIPPADLAVWRPSNGFWYVKGGPGSTETYYGWGMLGDQIAPGDYDGDGKTDFAIYRGATTGYWWITKSSDSNYYSAPQGTTGDKPVPGDYDGDGKTDTALYRPSTNYWYIINSSDSTVTATHWGSPSDLPAQGDFDGDGKSDLTVWRPSTLTFYPLRSSDGNTPEIQVGAASTDLPVSADYDGDHIADFAVLNGINWIIRKSSTGTTSSVSWQKATDIPVQNDYDGDGLCDIAVWRPTGKAAVIGHWYIRQSSRLGQSDELRDEAWGTIGDIPVPAYYRR